jgi:two-component system cell cycle sensor histidine kinase/response regulator CckA
MINDRDPNLSLGVMDHGGTVTVLLADDEEAIRRLVAPVLRSRGFTVLEAADGLEAIAVAEQFAGPIHLLLTDWSMPRLTGGELIRRLRKRRPEMATLVMSANMYLETLSNGPMLHKPFKLQELIDAVSTVLDSRMAKGQSQPLQ